MPADEQPLEPAREPQEEIGRAIQDLTAARLGRGFVPLGLTMLAGLWQLAASGPATPGAVPLIVGAGTTAIAMLAYGLRVTQRAFGRPPRRWMTLAMLGSLVPPFFALYVVAWRGLRLVFSGGGAASLASALLFTLVGIWIMRSWMKVVEVERLARVMQLSA